jgi:hypothetical protein
VKPCDWNWLICLLMWCFVQILPYLIPMHSIWYSFSVRKTFPRWLSREFHSREKLNISWRHLYSSVTCYRYNSFYANYSDTNLFWQEISLLFTWFAVVIFCVKISENAVNQGKYEINSKRADHVLPWIHYRNVYYFPNLMLEMKIWIILTRRNW